MSARRLVPFAVCLACLVSAAARVVAARDNVVSFSAPVVVTDPCTGESGTGTLEVLALVNEVRNAGQTHVAIHASLHGELTGDRGSVYHVSAEGTTQSSSVADAYDLPFHGNAVGNGTSPNVRVDGIASIPVGSGGSPIGIGLVSLSAHCGW